MVVAVVACVLGLVVVGWTLLRDDPLPEPSARRAPDWGPLPEPADLVRLEFARAVPGYDPTSVDAHLDALATAYRDLLAEAPPEVIARARRRAAARRGLALPTDAHDGDDVDDVVEGDEEALDPVPVGSRGADDADTPDDPEQPDGGHDDAGTEPMAADPAWPAVGSGQPRSVVGPPPDADVKEELRAEAALATLRTSARARDERPQAR